MVSHKECLEKTINTSLHRSTYGWR